jgi:hypothetical protein
VTLGVASVAEIAERVVRDYLGSHRRAVRIVVDDRTDVEIEWTWRAPRGWRDPSS